MFDHKVLDLVSLIGFTFGALAFSVLVLMYFRQRASKRSGARVLASFTAACAAAFITNMALRIVSLEAVDSPLVAVLALALGLTTSLLPPLVFHIVYTKEAEVLPHRRFWGFLLAATYAISLTTALLKALDDANLAAGGMSEWLTNAPAITLGISAALALAAQLTSRVGVGGVCVGVGQAVPPASHVSRPNHQRWNKLLLTSMLAAAALSIVVSSPWVSLLPDYLLLAFFCVTLYYEERLLFFDLLIKRGAFFAVALLSLPPILMLGLRIAGSPVDWYRCWICSLALAPFWLIAPWAYRRIEGAIDRGWLKRKYSLPDAEQRFVRDVQLASTEDDLRLRAASSLREIFQAPAHISLHESPPSFTGLTSGSVHIEPRPDGMPFLSDDHRLLQSLARTLSVVLDNVRFREREHHLQWLASRAELKALRAQMNPHFLFNALNAIAGLIVDQPRLADETIEQLAHVLRYTLRQSENEWVRLDEEIEFVTAYLRVEQARFGERLRVDFGVDSAASSIHVPAMTIQPLVENAIKHGVSTLEGTGKVGVKVVLEGDLLCAEVSDNGPGFPPGFSIGSGAHGLRNVADRLAGYYGSYAQLSWKNGSEGTSVSLKIPRVTKNGSNAYSNRG
jgi:two-component sensor histidine kinase